MQKRKFKRNCAWILSVLIGVTSSMNCVVSYAAEENVAFAEEFSVATAAATPTSEVTPTEKPTATPTEKPTATPTEKPTATPTEKPTATPTEKPTATPTEKPTATPTEKPTAIPTEKPTATPTEKPTATPTEKPTATPTEKPTVTPEAKPTATPEAKPTATPEAKPTTAPTVHTFSAEFTVDKEADCTTPGSKSRHCTDEGCTEKTDVTEIPALGHTWDEGKVIQEASCTEEGEKVYSCAVCNETRTEVIKKIEHDYLEDKCTVCGEIEKLSAVVTPNVSNIAGGIQLKWEKVKYATGYLVYRKTGNGGYSIIETIQDDTTLSYTDTEAVEGVSYTYAVRGTKGNLKSGYKAVTVLRLTNPVVKTTNIASGIRVEWSEVKGAANYIVYRKSGSASYESLTTIKAAGTLNYVDENAVSGTTYTYAVRAAKGSTRSAYKAVTLLRLSNPVVKTTNIASGVRLNWGKVKGAESYIVYRKSGSGTYKALTTIKNAETLTYTDKSGVSGTTYTYAVRAENGTTRSAYKAVAILRLSNPAVKTENVVGGVQLKWGKIKGATSYVVYRKTETEGYEALATVKENVVSYIDKSAGSRVTYTYAVRAAKGSTKSAYTEVKQLHLGTPSVKAANVKKTVLVSWNSIKGAKNYAVYRKTGNGKYEKIATVDTKTLKYSDTKVKTGTTYTYAVRAVRDAVRSSYTEKKIKKN